MSQVSVSAFSWCARITALLDFCSGGLTHSLRSDGIRAAHQFSMSPPQAINSPVRLDDRTWYVDVLFRGQPKLIGCVVLECSSGLILIDPGPASTLDALTAALLPLGGLSCVRHIVLTHIHLDHAGATGMIVRRQPQVRVHVHPIGAPHLIQPERLIRSAKRIYGDRFDGLWGPVMPVPAAQIRTVVHNDELVLNDRRLLGLYTPGHASHHVAWLDRSSGILYAGDAAGMRVMEASLIIPVAPPPDIDIERWDDSLELLAAQESRELFLTHFGPVRDVSAHLKAMHERLHGWSEAVRASLNQTGDDASKSAQFHEAEMNLTRASVAPEFLTPYTIMGQPSGSWYGLARYWRKKEAPRSVQVHSH